MNKKDFFELINMVEPLINESQRREKLTQMFEDLWPRFSTCPASTKFHGSYTGGLLDHTAQVVKISMTLYEYFRKMQDLTFLLDSLIFCALVHDIGKIGTRTHEIYLLNGKKFDFNTDVNKIDHELLTLFWLNHYGIFISEGEMAAIYYHAGPYVDSYKKVTETDLMMILHSADNLSAKVGNT